MIWDGMQCYMALLHYVLFHSRFFPVFSCVSFLVFSPAYQKRELKRKKNAQKTQEKRKRIKLVFYIALSVFSRVFKRFKLPKCKPNA